jgi:23S rRNA (cytidine1920-2'-O)/16S rRNA (cytidine1409-2'-O)-methyltransferase
VTAVVTRARLDAELVRRGLARSRQQAAELIEQGRVAVRGVPAGKPATVVDRDTPITVQESTEREWASRGAHKLIGALEAFPTVQVKGRRTLDAGASTGGFTDVLLRNEAAHVIAVDVGYGQLVWALQTDERVTVMDRTNVRTLTLEDIGGEPVDLVVSDLSFISLTLVLPALLGVVKPDGELVLMVKPQFEVGKDRLGKGGVVRDPELRAEAVRTVAAKAHALGWGIAGVAASPLPGPSGNVEYFLWIRREAPALDETMLQTAIASGPQ